MTCPRGVLGCSGWLSCPTCYYGRHKSLRLYQLGWIILGVTLAAVVFA